MKKAELIKENKSLKDKNMMAFKAKMYAMEDAEDLRKRLKESKKDAEFIRCEYNKMMNERNMSIAEMKRLREDLKEFAGIESKLLEAQEIVKKHREHIRLYRVAAQAMAEKIERLEG